MKEYLLGEFIKNFRESHGLSLRSFGDKCGLSHTTIDYIEKGYDPRTMKPVNITNEILKKLAAGMNVSPRLLFDLSCGIDSEHSLLGGFNMNRIAELRKAINISQAELGKIIGVAQNTICNWENGNREPDQNSLTKLAVFFNVSTDYLLGCDSLLDATQTMTPQGTSSPRPMSDDDLKFALWGDYQNIDDADLQDVKRYAEFIKARKENEK